MLSTKYQVPSAEFWGWVGPRLDSSAQDTLLGKSSAQDTQLGKSSAQDTLGKSFVQGNLGKSRLQ